MTYKYNSNCAPCGSATTSDTPEGVEYIDPSCEEVTEVEDKLKVIGKKAVMQLTVDVWDTIGCEDDNIVRMYNSGECVYKDGLYYWSKEDGNIDTPPSAKWSEGVTKCEMLQPSEDSNCVELAYGFGTDSGNSAIAGHYTYDFSKKNESVWGGMIPIAGGFKVPRDGIYKISTRLSAQHLPGVADNPNLFISVELNGVGLQDISSGGAGVDPVFSERFKIVDAGELLNGARDDKNRWRIMELNAGDELTVATQTGGTNNWPGFAGHKKGAADFMVEELPRKVSECP